MIRCTCPHCAAVFKVRDENAGKQGRCPRCQQVVSFPFASASVSPFAGIHDETDEESPPERRRRRRVSVGCWAAIAAVCLIGIGAIGAVVVFRGHPSLPLPASWTSPQSLIHGDWERVEDGELVILTFAPDGGLVLTTRGVRARGHYRFLASDRLEMEIKGPALLGDVSTVATHRVSFRDRNTLRLTAERNGGIQDWHRH